MIFRVTQKLAKKIKAAPVAGLPPPENAFLDWTANSFMVSRWQFILLTHSRSLYSVVMAGKGIVSEETFVGRSLKGLSDSMALDGIGFLFDDYISPNTDPVTFCVTGDRRVLGSMNDMIFHARMHLLESGLPLALVNMRLNKMPMSMLELHFPKLALLSLADLPES